MGEASVGGGPLGGVWGRRPSEEGPAPVVAVVRGHRGWGVRMVGAGLNASQTGKGVALERGSDSQDTRGPGTSSRGRPWGPQAGGFLAERTSGETCKGAGQPWGLGRSRQVVTSAESSFMPMSPPDGALSWEWQPRGGPPRSPGWGC